MNKKLLATSLLSACAFAGLAVGGTFALFTSTAEANVAIHTATVKYEATVLSDSLKLYSMGVAQSGTTFENGGTAALSGNDLTLINVTPGDKAEFEIKIVNTSTVKTAYRVVITNESGESNPFTLSGEAASWSQLDANTNPSANVKIGVELPASVGDEYQGKSYALKITVEAVQANGIASVADAAALTTAIQEGKIAELTGDVSVADASVLEANAKLDLGGHTLTIADDSKAIVMDDSKLSISNGTIALDAAKASHVFAVQGGELDLTNVTLNQNDALAEKTQSTPVKLDKGVVNIVDSVITTNHTYAIAQNNIDSDNGDITLNIVNSKIAIEGNEEYDDAAICINSDKQVNLNIKNSVVSGNRQALLLRTGKAVAKNSSFISDGKFFNTTYGQSIATAGNYMSGNWKSGNEVPAAAIVVGDTNAANYNLPASLELENCTIKAENGAKKAVIASDGTYAATLKADAASLAVGDVTKIGDANKITVTIA